MPPLPIRAEVAQLAEHSPEKAGVDSSILSLGTTYHYLHDVELALGRMVAPLVEPGGHFLLLGTDFFP